MDVIILVAQTTGIFLAAFLAFFLENVRERRRTAAWVRDHLNNLSRTLVPGDVERDTKRRRQALNEQLEAIDEWLHAMQSSDMDDALWNHVCATIHSTVPDFGAVLRTDAIAVVPRDLAQTLVELEVRIERLRDAVDSLLRSQRDLLPAWHERQVPLQPPNQSRAELLKQAIVECRAEQERTNEALLRALELISLWHR